MARQQLLQRKWSLLVLFAAIAVVLLSVVLIEIQGVQQGIFDITQMHLAGGFSADTPQKLAQAANEGIGAVFYYGQPPAENSQMGQKLLALHMQVVDGFIGSYLYYYECHRTKTVKPPPLGDSAYCVTDYHQELNSEDAVLAVIAAHLRQVRSNHLIVGYWVLDDWVPWDTGSARDLLIKVHNLIQHYTPGRPAICGFGGFLGKSSAGGADYGWLDGLADNFSAQGCDMVGLYIYTPALAVNLPASYYDWSMAKVLPAVFTSLEKRGWNSVREPLIGIAQAFGGPRRNTDLYWAIPDADDIVTQSKSFCKHGATGIVYYGWDDSTFGPGMQTPVNNTGIDRGIQEGIAACKQIWGYSP